MGVGSHGKLSVLDNETAAVHGADFHVGHVPQQNGIALAPLKNHFLEFVQIVAAREAQGIAPLAHVREPARDILAVGQLDHARQFDAEAGRLVGIEGDADLLLTPAAHLGHGHARHALEAVLHHFLDKILIGGDVAVVARQGLENEPGDGAAVAAHCADDRLVRIGRIARHAVETVENLQQGAPQIRANGKGDTDLAGPALRLGEYADGAGETTQGILLRLDDLGFHLLGRRGAPVGGDADLRLLYLGRQLHRQAAQADGAEQHGQQHRHDDGHGVAQGQAGEIHRGAFPFLLSGGTRISPATICWPVQWGQAHPPA